MKRFKVYGANFGDDDYSAEEEITAESLQELMLNIEKNRGWFVETDFAFKVVFVEEVNE